MSIAEQKIELLRLIVEADEIMVDQLLAFTRQLENKDQNIAEAVALYEKRNEEFTVSGEKGYSREESIALLRKQLK